ncbi:MAG: hypothetical protein ACE5G1_12110, partial [bacterium]
MTSIVYYISGHGYGHTVRSIELIKSLQHKRPNLFFHIRTDAPSWLFELNLQSNYHLHPLPIDVGAIQETSFQINKQKTLVAITELYSKKDAIVARENAFVKETNAIAVIADIPPLAFEIAAAAGIPSVGLANFSWDWIYEDFVDELPQFESIIQMIKASYSKSTLLLRLPFYGDLSAFPRIKDIPLITRKATKPKEEVWQLLDIEPKNRVALALVAFRASDLKTVDFRKIARMDRFITMGLPETHDNCLNIPPNFIRFPELLNACDVVISKPGYGLVAEVLANRTPLLYTTREDFAELEVLTRGLKEYAVAKEIRAEDFFAGNW